MIEEVLLVKNTVKYKEKEILHSTNAKKQGTLKVTVYTDFR